MSHRSPGNTNCSISIAKKTLRQAQKLAATERRTFSNYVTLLLEREIRRDAARALRTLVPCAKCAKPHVRAPPLEYRCHATRLATKPTVAPQNPPQRPRKLHCDSKVDYKTPKTTLTPCKTGDSGQIKTGLKPLVNTKWSIAGSTLPIAIQGVQPIATK